MLRPVFAGALALGSLALIDVAFARAPLRSVLVCDNVDLLRPCNIALEQFRPTRTRAARRHALKRGARHLVIARAIPRPRPSLGRLALVAPLAAKVAEIEGGCHSRLVSGLRHTLIAGTKILSLHASGKAADLAGDPGCIYAHLVSWPGGYSIDYARMRHVHISYDPFGREWGAHFRHGGPRYARRHRHHHLARAAMIDRHH